VKIHDMSNLQETSSILTVEEDEVERLSWSEDGQLLAVVTHSGTIYVYLSQLPIVWSVYNTHVAVLTSLTELTLYSCEQENKVSHYNQGIITAHTHTHTHTHICTRAHAYTHTNLVSHPSCDN